jgi:hypothetical protein
MKSATKKLHLSLRDVDAYKCSKIQHSKLDCIQQPQFNENTTGAQSMLTLIVLSYDRYA